jgi:DNA-binding CsgD family transcriptional regulator/PAS domain-containing protein
VSSDNELLDIIGGIYDCILDPSQWPATLERTARWVGVSAVGINVKNPARRVVTFLCAWGGNPDYRQLYRDTYFALNPAMTAGWFVGLHEPVTCSGFAGLNEWLSCRMYREWMRPQAYLDACGLNLTKDATHHSMLSVIRSEDKGWFTEEEFDRLRRLSPHFRRAVLIGDLLDRRTLLREEMAATLDLLTAGVVLVDANAVIIHANAAALRLLDDGAVVRRVGGSLSTHDRRLAKELRASIAAAASEAGQGQASGVAIPIVGSADRELVAWVLPLTYGLRHEFAAPFSASVAVFLRDCDTPAALPGELFIRRYGITPAESRVLMMNVQGMTAEDIAEALGISEATVKTHLKNLFAKTGAHRQSDLVRLAMAVLPPVITVRPIHDGIAVAAAPARRERNAPPPSGPRAS